WTVESDCDHAVRTGDTVVCASGCGIAIRRLDDGRTVTHWTAPYASSLAVARDAIATRTRSVIRVWDPAIAGGVEVELAGRGGPTMFSPDGSRLYSAGLLCDARDGRVIAALDEIGDDIWLEGGPPVNFEHLGVGSFVEVFQFGTKLWDTRTGELIYDDRELSAGAMECCTFDPRH